MPTFILSATPATRTIGQHFTSTQMALLDKVAEPVRVEARNVTEVAERVLAFGSSVATARPGVSFLVCVRVVRGQRKPRGFDAANQAETFHNAAWLHAAIEQPAPHAHGPGVRMWGGRFTPFQLDGQAPIWPDATPDEFTRHADGSVGLYGSLRAVNARVQRETETLRNLFDVASGVDLRERYRARTHPFDVAAELLSATGPALLDAA
ncbi:hypothetical protein HLH33_16690 [Gluconacetobacter diazotrophicus]|uniref:Uncharacterized protein n=1 Tax=Gluconacetobacter diazotrophicus TaxID=33996 RepID=A0A7W4NMF5_GLUDI|nr:hypothetical protein [Gluconacetobacter diazotrophicus]MBB2157918.1 hypothetical protein [Gluconacetobacter diazotrophicus]